MDGKIVARLKQNDSLITHRKFDVQTCFFSIINYLINNNLNNKI